MHTILKKQNLKHPMHEEIINKYSSNYNEIVNYLIGEIPKNKKIWYQKHMAHHILDLNNIEWINNCHNCYFIKASKRSNQFFHQKKYIELCRRTRLSTTI